MKDELLLDVSEVSVIIEGSRILENITFSVGKGEVHVIMGPNGSGKSTLALALAGKPGYEVTGRILFKGQDLLALAPDERARAGLFLSFQSPTPIEGLSLMNLLKEALAEKIKATGGTSPDVRSVVATIRQEAHYLKLAPSFLNKNLNVDMSGGEKKKSELLQMLVLKPDLVILDEIDSGLDIDAVKEVGTVINEMVSRGTAFLIITHYVRILRYIERIDKVYILSAGKIIKEGSRELADLLEEHGYAGIT